jgi:glucose-6-phosphate 1-dehydrogenase
VPITLESGKGLKKKETNITVTFRPVEKCYCPSQEKYSNVVEFDIAPKEGINMRFVVKKPGLETEVEPREFSFSYRKPKAKSLGGYDKVLYDCVRGDHMLFTNTDEVAAAWAFITPIIRKWKHTPLLKYEKGSDGPLV